MTTEGDTMTTPQGLPTLHAGAHKPGDGKACIMEYVALLAGEQWSDTPACTHPVLALVAQSVNDGVSDADRHLLVPLIGRLFGTGIGDRAESLRVTVGLAVWAKGRAAKSAAEYAAESAASAGYAAKCAAESAAESAESAGYAAKSAAEYAESAAKSAESAESAEYAVASAGYAAKCAAHAAKCAEAAASAAYAAARRVGFLADLIDEYDRLTGRTNHRVISTPELTELAQLVTT